MSDAIDFSLLVNSQAVFARIGYLQTDQRVSGRLAKFNEIEGSLAYHTLMSDDADNRTLELLRRMRTEMGEGFRKVDADLQNLTTEVRLANAHVAALVQGEVHTTSRIAELDVRLSRVEKRLELRDE